MSFEKDIDKLFFYKKNKNKRYHITCEGRAVCPPFPLPHPLLDDAHVSILSLAPLASKK